MTIIIIKCYNSAGGFISKPKILEVRMCKHTAPLIVAGLIFALIAFLHLLRFFVGWDVIVGTFAIPVWWSGIGLIIAALLAFWMFKSACSSSNENLDE